MNSVVSDSPNAHEGGQQTLPVLPCQSRAYLPAALIKTFVAATAAATAYEWAKQFVFPHITPLQSHAITVFLFGAVSTLGVYLALRRRSEFLAQIQTQLTECNKAQAALIEERHLFHTLMDNLPDYIYFKDLESRFTRVNRAVAKVFGLEEPGRAIGKTDFDFFADEHARQAFAEEQEIIRTGQPMVGMEEKETWPDGRVTWVSTTKMPLGDAGGNIIGTFGVSRDVTERKRLEEQFIQAQKMEAVGRLAAGVAHDFNNLLTIINGHTGLMLKQLPSEDPARDSLAEIKDAGERAAELIRQLQAFSRQQVRTSSVLNLNTLVANSIKMLRRLIGEDIELVFNPVPDSGMVCVDPAQIERVLMNLAVHSRDAMPKGGTLSIEISNFQADEAYAKSHYPMNPGAYVMLAVSDTGSGMDAETQSRIFEPFFPTKGLGKGTGLGLATVYGIIKQNGGYIWVCSELGKGATFKIYLPVVEGTPEATGTRGAKGGGSETVLLVEDEVKLRSLARRILETEGYEVLEAPGAMEALLIASQHKGPIHILVADVVMPVMSGRELAERLAKVHSQMKILYMLGCTGDTIVRHGVLESEVAFLQKPFAPELLARKVRDALDA